MMGEPAAPAAEPEPRDRRFLDPDWSENPFFDFLKQLYLVTRRWASDLVEQAEGVDEHTRHKAGFYSADRQRALAVEFHPHQSRAVARDACLQRREPRARHAHAGRGHQGGRRRAEVRQTDHATPSSSARTSPRRRARSSSATTLPRSSSTRRPPKTVLKRPLLIVPPWINKFYILDLDAGEIVHPLGCRPGPHGVRHLLGQSRRAAGDKGFEHYMREGIFAAVDVDRAGRPAEGRSTPSAIASAARLLAVALA